MAIKCLTLYEPYCSLIACGAKTVETRSWGTHYRGWLAIHASRRWSKAIVTDCLRCAGVLAANGFVPPTLANAACASFCGHYLGCILAVARLVNCRPMTAAPDALNADFGTFGEGRYGWALGDVVPLPHPVPARGAMGLWNLPLEVGRAVLAEAGISAGVG